MNNKILKCNMCGQIVFMIKDTGAMLTCCNSLMDELECNTNEEVTFEKHLPIISILNNKITVKVGEKQHPSTPNHYIEWIAIKTTNGYQMKYLTPNNLPEATFYLDENEKLVEAYAYCNIHGLYKTKYEIRHNKEEKK